MDDLKEKIEAADAELAAAKADLANAKSDKDRDLILTYTSLVTALINAGSSLRQQLHDLQFRLPPPPDSIFGNMALSNQSEHLSRFHSYTEIATKLSDDDSVKRLITLIQKVESCPATPNPPFIFLEGSSGVGKTQMAFNVMNALTTERFILYLVATPCSENAQDIYKMFSAPSDLFIECVAKDLINYSIVTPEHLFNSKLYTFGFIEEFVRQGYGGTADIQKRTRTEIQHIVGSRSLLIILDEFVSLDDATSNRARFMRNVFRCLMMPVILLGTDSRAANLRLIQDHSSVSGSSPRDWCFVYGKFPTVKATLVGLPANSDTFLKSLLLHSRPRFCQYAAEFVRSNPSSVVNASYVDSLLDATFARIVADKNVFNEEFGRLGQLRLFLNASYGFKDVRSSDNDVKAQLIHRHFAQLDGPQDFTIDSCGNVGGVKWIPSSVFPPMMEDLLLYLTMMGGPNRPAFQKLNVRVPYFTFLGACMKTNKTNSVRIVFDNASQSANDGPFLEAIMVTSIIVASHSGGLSGVSLKRFIESVSYELIPDKQYQFSSHPQPIVHAHADPAQQVDLSHLSEFTVPFLSPSNLAWPTFLHNLPNANFSNIYRTRNVERLDFSTDCFITGEAKNYRSPISQKVMIQIFQRIPHDSVLHVVFVRKLQESYFCRSSSPTFESMFGPESKANTCTIGRVDNVSETPFLSPIVGLPHSNPSAQCSVLFFCL
uniref:Uncharacterized protein n=1 Tax=Spongospora subterranea TaxID=70186 RepID=A0A0H5QXK5_9EUKA|eukprot:CRZ06728.1 hypothetical protein [Spongospora subterranea]